MAGPWTKYQQQGAQPVQISPPDPRLPAQVQGEHLGNRQKQQQISQDDALAPIKLQQAQTDLAKARADLEKARSGEGLDRQKLANMRAAQAQVDRLHGLYKTGPGRTKGLSGVLDFLPTPRNAQFNTAGAGLGEVGLAAFRVPGVGAQSDAELKAFIDANRPSASDFDATIQEKLRNLQSRLDQTYSAYGVKRQSAARKKPQSKVIDFNDLPE